MFSQLPHAVRILSDFFFFYVGSPNLRVALGIFLPFPVIALPWETLCYHRISCADENLHLYTHSAFWGSLGFGVGFFFFAKTLCVTLKRIAVSFFVCSPCVGVCMYQWRMTSGDLKVNDIFSKKTSIWVTEHIVFLKTETRNFKW